MHEISHGQTVRIGNGRRSIRMYSQSDCQTQITQGPSRPVHGSRGGRCACRRRHRPTDRQRQAHQQRRWLAEQFEQATPVPNRAGMLITPSLSGVRAGNDLVRYSSCQAFATFAIATGNCLIFHGRASGWWSWLSGCTVGPHLTARKVLRMRMHHEKGGQFFRLSVGCCSSLGT